MAARAEETMPGLGSNDEDGDSGMEDSDSGMGVSVCSDNESISSSIYAYPVEHGRTYHAHHDGTYLFPNDEMEQDRLDLQHEMFLRLFGGKRYLCPIKTPSNVLDLGTGTGIWAQELADSLPEWCQVMGVDLSPIQPIWLPPNCHFEVFDFNDRWTFKRKFDLICGRMLIGSISSPQPLFQEVFKALVPGGWVEIQDVCPPTLISQESAFRKWRDEWCTALQKGGRDPYLAKELPQILTPLGFKNVTVQEFRIPQSGSLDIGISQELGKLNLLNILEGIEGLSLKPFLNVGWTFSELQVLLAHVRAELSNEATRAYWPV